MRRVLVTGASGGLGRYVTHAFAAKGFEVIAPSHADLDITDAYSVENLILNRYPYAVIHLAAYADVPGCAANPSRAFAVNVRGTANVVRAVAMQSHARMIYMSTDAVFSAGGPHGERDREAPASAYAWSKLAGEQPVLTLGRHGLVVRANFFTRHCNVKRSFAAYVVDSALKGEAFDCYANVQSTPVFAGTLAERIVRALLDQESGILHVASLDAVNRAEQARRITLAYGIAIDTVRSVESTTTHDGRLVGRGVTGPVASEVAKMVAAEPLEPL